MFTANQCMHLTAFGVGILTSRNKPSFPLILKPRLLHSQRLQLYHIQPRASQDSRIYWLQIMPKLYDFTAAWQFGGDRSKIGKA